ncbi:hypothetical protein [Salibacterium aidingense]|uniref:hypothetical protein n=1 Tax=Salibacterium aidingense TaxID=384933 RepID=UPI00040CF99B|nr:hypothetical protein [Salibacterium aidingense]
MNFVHEEIQPADNSKKQAGINMMKFFIPWIMVCFLMAPVPETYAAPLQKEEKELVFESPERLFSMADSTIDILHIADEDEYQLEWEGRLETHEPCETLQVKTLLFEDGYVKESSTAWAEQRSQLASVKQTASEDTSRYDVISYFAVKDAPVFSFDWDEAELYVLDTPMTDLHSFKEAKSREEQKAKQMIDTIIRQQQSHIKRIIRDKKDLSEETKLFPLNDRKQWKAIMASSILSPSVLEDVWLDIFHKLVEETDKHNTTEKKGMPFVGWDQHHKKLTLYIHYGKA